MDTFVMVAIVIGALILILLGLMIRSAIVGTEVTPIEADPAEEKICRRTFKRAEKFFKPVRVRRPGDSFDTPCEIAATVDGLDISVVRNCPLNLNFHIELSYQVTVYREGKSIANWWYNDDSWLGFGFGSRIERVFRQVSANSKSRVET